MCDIHYFCITIICLVHKKSDFAFFFNMKLKSTKSPSMEDLLSPSKLLFNPCQELHTGFISEKARLKHGSKYLLASSKNKFHRHFAVIKDDISIEN